MMAEEVWIRRFECPKCGALLQIDGKDYPSKCTCGETSGFVLLSTEYNQATIDKTRIVFGECYERIIEVLKYYLDLPFEQYQIISLWILGTWLHESFESYPYLFLNAMKGSAKTRTLKLISHLACKGNGEVQAGINETTFYRSEKGASLILDEVEKIAKKEKEELRGYLNSAYKKGSVVTRSKKVSSKGNEGYVLEKFEPYRPVAMANIWGMEEVLGSRCITLILEKSSNSFWTKIVEDFDENELLMDIKRTLGKIQCRLVNVCSQKKMIKGWNTYIKEKYHTPSYTHTLLTQPTQPTSSVSSNILEDELFFKIDSTGIEGRDLELFFPLFQVSLLLNEETFFKTLEIAKALVNSKRSEELTESRDVSFIEFVSVQEKYRFSFVRVQDLTTQFREFIGYADEEDKWITKEWLGRALKRLNLATAKRRVSRGSEVTLNVEKAKEKLKMFKREEKDE